MVRDELCVFMERNHSIGVHGAHPPRSSPPGLCNVNNLAGNLHGLVDPLFGSSWQEWHRYKLHRGKELDPWVKEWPPSWVYDLTHGRRRGLF